MEIFTDSKRNTLELAMENKTGFSDLTLDIFGMKTEAWIDINIPESGLHFYGISSNFLMKKLLEQWDQKGYDVGVNNKRVTTVGGRHNAISYGIDVIGVSPHTLFDFQVILPHSESTLISISLRVPGAYNWGFFWDTELECFVSRSIYQDPNHQGK